MDYMILALKAAIAQRESDRLKSDRFPVQIRVAAFSDVMTHLSRNRYVRARKRRIRKKLMS